MNRIEQVAAPASVPAPAQQPKPRLPRPRSRSRALAVVRRRAARAMAQPADASPRGRRGASGLAVIAALAVPLAPSPAFGAVSSTGSAPEAPQTRHHLHDGHLVPDHVVPDHVIPDRVIPDPGVMTVQGWTTASGWSFTIPTRPTYPGLWDHVPSMHHEGRYGLWPAELAGPIDHPRQVVLPDGTRGEISAYHVSKAGPRADDSGRSSTSSPPVGQAPPRWSTGGPSASPIARARVVPQPLIPFLMPANTKQMMAAPRQADDVPADTLSRPSAPEHVVAAVDTSASSCLVAAYPVGDRYMVAHPRPMTDAMGIVVTHHRATCAVKVDYLSQARA